MKKIVLTGIVVMLILFMFCCNNEVTTKNETFLSDNTAFSLLTTKVATNMLNTKAYMVKSTYKQQKATHVRLKKGKLKRIKPHTQRRKKSTNKHRATKKKKAKKSKSKSSAVKKHERTRSARCTAKHNHSQACGNVGRWFNSKSDVKAFVDKEMKYWADLEESGQITREEYYKKCPSGYECWSCAYCGKWTGNFKY